MIRKTYSYLLCLLLLIMTVAQAENPNRPIIINATMTAFDIILSPDTIPTNTPFVIHVINKSGVPAELENADTSVEIYADMDRTFKVGLTDGAYVFFNDFNPHAKTATLMVKKGPISRDGGSQGGESRFFPFIPSIRFPDAQDINNNSSILFIVWRESVEALLVIGIVYGWLKQNKQAQRTGILFLWLGVVIGLLCAVFLSFILVRTNLQALMTFIAAIMIVYMVKWMRNNAQKLKPGMLQALQKNSANLMAKIFLS